MAVTLSGAAGDLAFTANWSIAIHLRYDYSLHTDFVLCRSERTICVTAVAPCASTSRHGFRGETIRLLVL